MTHFIFLGALLLLTSIVLSKTSYRFGVPALLLFLVTGILGGSEGIGGIEFNDYGFAQFIGNVNSHKFHSPDCANLPSEKKRIIFDTYKEAIDAGYTPCGSCLG